MSRRESQADLLASLNPLPNGEQIVIEDGDRIIREHRVRLGQFQLVNCHDWTMREEDLHPPYVVWDAPKGPILVCSDDNLYRLSGLEALMLRSSLLDLKRLDRDKDARDCQG